MSFEQIFKEMEPQDVLKKFYDISQIPRMPGNQKQISDYMMAWAKELGLEASQDEYYNVLVVKPATAGYEKHDTVILQAHLDMVCEKEPNSNHDFSREPLQLICDGEVLKAEGTTLGADDGIGVAMIMALFEDGKAKHPRLEGLFTVDEETDMGGAWGFDCSRLKGTTMINLDANAIVVAGAGELEVEMRFPKEKEKITEGSRIKILRVGGLMGGHSGANSMMERGNAIMLINRILLELDKKLSYQVLYMQGGAGMSSAFARNATVAIAYPPSQEEIVMQIIDKQKEAYDKELEIRDPAWTLKIEDGNADAYDGEAMNDKTAGTLKTVIQLLPDGINTINRKFPNCMESTSNVGVVETEEDQIYLTILIRAMMASRKYDLYDKIIKICQLLHIQTSVARDIPHWEYKISDELLKLAKDIYADKAIELAQGTLETGIFNKHMPDIQIIALGCPYYNAHSPAEYLLVSEIKEYQKRLKTILEKI